MSIAADIMQTDILTAQPSESISSVVYNMAVNDVGAVLVLEGEKLASIFTERDLLKRVIAEQRSFDDVIVEEVATSEPISVVENTTLRECAHILQEKNIRHLPVVDSEKRPVGIISSRDFFRRLTLLFHQKNEDPYAELVSTGAK